MTLVYVAHPLGGDIDANAARALRWLSWLHDVEPDVSFVAGWLVGVQLFRLRYAPGIDDRDHSFRARMMRTNIATVRRCDGIVLCGGAFTAGMAEEQGQVGIDRPYRFHDRTTPKGWTSDLTSIGKEPPPTHEAWGDDHAPPLAWGCSQWQRRQAEGIW